MRGWRCLFLREERLGQGLCGRLMGGDCWMFHPSLGLAISRLLGLMFFGLVYMLSSREICYSSDMKIDVGVNLPVKHGTPRGVLVPAACDAFEGLATIPVLLDQSCAFSTLPWTSQVTLIRKALPYQHLATANQASSRLPHEAPGRNPPQMFHHAPRQHQTSEPFAAAARREHSMIVPVELAYRPDSSGLA